jgi:hypothetical protein
LLNKQRETIGDQTRAGHILPVKQLPLCLVGSTLKRGMDNYTHPDEKVLSEVVETLGGLVK